MPDILAPQLQYSSGTPDRIIMFAEVGHEDAQNLATNAVYHARMTMPRVTGAHASRLMPVFGEGYFGIYFPDATTWFLEHGSKPFTMRSLAGKTIPMWVEDKDGSIRAKNPKVKTRQTQDGRLQVLIFRKAAKFGQKGASYPGAPGRISVRMGNGRIGPGNVGVKWRHPGLQALQFLNGAMAETAFSSSLPISTVYVCDGSSFEGLVQRQKTTSGGR